MLLIGLFGSASVRKLSAAFRRAEWATVQTHGLVEIGKHAHVGRAGDGDNAFALAIAFLDLFK